MKYWRGFLVAAVLAACTYGLRQFAQAHSALVDMVYPYATRMGQTFLTDWSSGVDYCLWQVLVVAFVVLVLASAVLMVVLKWNPIRWLGWVAAVVSLIVLANTIIYGLNQYSGPITQDIRLEEADYTVGELEAAAVFFRDQAKAAESSVQRDGKQVKLPDFEELNAQAENGFNYMKTQEYQSVFAGSTQPVKPLVWEGYFTGRGVDGVVMGLTGEAALNMRTPTAIMPFTICRLMAQRMCIANAPDANLAAYLAASHNEQPHYRYAAYLAAYYHCTQLLEKLPDGQSGNVLERVQAGESANMTNDLETLEDFYGKLDAEENEQFCKYLVSLYIQEQVLPQIQEEEALFDPLNKEQVDLSGIVNAGA